MELLFNNIVDGFTVFIIVFARMTGLFLLSPILGRRNIPSYAKIGLSLLLSYIVFSSKLVVLEAELNSWLHLAYCIIKELLVGFVMGFVTTLTFSAIWTAGQILDTQIGFGIISTIDPQNNIQIPLMANFNNMLALLLFFTLDGHHKLIQIIFDSYDLVPFGGGVITKNLSMGMVKLFTDSFILSVKIAIPIIAASFFSVIAFGILARAVPQINVFIVQIPFKIFIGLVVLLIAVPFFIRGLNILFENMFSNIATMIQELIPR